MGAHRAATWAMCLLQAHQAARAAAQTCVVSLARPGAALRTRLSRAWSERAGKASFLPKQSGNCTFAHTETLAERSGTYEQTCAARKISSKSADA